MNATATATAKVKTHIDGGSYTEVAFAETRNGWGISITRWTTYRNTVVFEVNRVSADSKTLRLGHFATETDARSFANKMWLRDK
jgi:hypothetical protein